MQRDMSGGFQVRGIETGAGSNAGGSGSNAGESGSNIGSGLSAGVRGSMTQVDQMAEERIECWLKRIEQRAGKA